MATSSRFSFRRLPWLVFKAVIWFVVISVAWVALYRFVPPPVTFTMLGNALDGRGIHKRSEEHTSELQSLMRISYAVFCLKKINFIIISFNYFIIYFPDIFSYIYPDI